MIENGCGIIKVPDNKLKDFTILLSEFYSTNNKEKIKQFIFDDCIDGIVFENNQKFIGIILKAELRDIVNL